MSMNNERSNHCTNSLIGRSGDQSLKSYAETAQENAAQERKNSSLRRSQESCSRETPSPVVLGSEDKLDCTSGGEKTVTPSDFKKQARVRWGYLVPRFVLLAIFWAAMTFGLDPMLRYGITTGTGASLGTIVGIDRLRSNLFSPSLKIERIQIADRDQAGENAVEIDRIEVHLDRNALLRKKFVVNRATVSGISWNTDSTLSPKQKQAGKKDSGWSIPFRLGAGQLSKAAKQSGSDLVEDLLAQVLSPYNPRDFETVQLADIKQEQWNNRFANYRDSASQLKKRIETLKEKIELSKKGNPLDNLERYAQIAREVDQLTERGKQLKAEFSQLGNIAKADFAELDAAKTRDYNRLRSEIASLPVNPEQLTQTILGPETRRQFEQVAQWIQLIQQCMDVATEDYKPARSYGRTVSFNQADRLPSFLIREFCIDGVARSQDQPIPFRGILKDVTHAPKQYGKPIQYEIQISHHGNTSLTGTIDLTGQVPRYSLNCKVESQEFPVQNLLDHEHLQLSLLTGKMQGLVQITLVGNTINATLSWNQSDVNFLVQGDMQLEQPELSKLGFSPISPVDLLKRSVDGIDGIHGEVRIQGKVNSPSIELRSDIGEKIAMRLRKEFRIEAQLRQEEARLIAKKQIDQRMQKLNSQINQQYRTALAELKINESLVQSLLDKVAVRPASGVLNRLFR